MAERHRRLDVKLYLPHAVAATVGTVVVPAAVVCAVVLWADTPLWASALLGVALSTVAVTIGNLLWNRRPGSVDLSFGELMIWGWYRRKRAEERLARGEHLLGIDRTEDLPRVVRVDSDQQLTILRDLTTALESKDPYTHGHSRRVEEHVARTSTVMGLAGLDIDDLKKAASLHDVGKIRVPDRILRKQGVLTLEERIVLEDHVLVGAWMVSSVGNTDVVLGVRHHHERWDGSGYPNGLVGTEIPLFARIIAVADAFDAMTSSRPYRASLGRDYALYVIQSEAGRQFDPIVVEAFVSNLPTRIPAAAFVPLLAGPQRLLRELAASFTRVGAGNLASAVGAVGAAAIIGAVTLPSLEPSEREPATNVAGSQIDQGEEEPTPTPPEGRDGPKVSLKKPKGEDTRGPAGRERGKKRERGVRVAVVEEPAVEEPAAEPEVIAEEPEPQPGPDDGAEEPKPDNDDGPEPKPDKDEEPEPQPGKEEEPEPDPEPDDEEPEPQPGKDEEPELDTGDDGVAQPADIDDDSGSDDSGSGSDS